MVRTKEQILEAIRGKLGEDNSDEAIALLEDISDTLNDYDNKTKDDTEWKTKYEENDKAWRKKYTDRFFNKEAEEELKKDLQKEKDSAEGDDEEVKPEITSFNDLFSTEKE